MAAGCGWSREGIHFYRYIDIVVARPLTQKEQLTFKETTRKQGNTADTTCMLAYYCIGHHKGI